MAAVRWWATLLVIGTAAAPLTYVLFRRLPDRGYAFVKLIGLLIISYVFWLFGSLGFLSNSLGSILVGLGTLAALSAVALIHHHRSAPPDAPRSMMIWVRDQRWQILITELLFLAIFALWVWVRAQNPAISATEKPMEFAFLNSVGRSPQFPPLDPWMSGFAISYYYFGYVMVSIVARLASVSEAVAFNLGIAWLVAASAVAGFGVVFNLLRAQGARRSAVVLGLVAGLAIPIAGNLEVALEVAHANNVGSAEFWQWLDVRDLNTPPVEGATARYENSSWWWWRSSRVIHEYHLSGRAEEGLEPIAEFPGFSFILGDMHPHVLALPFGLFSLALAFLWYLESSRQKAPPLDDEAGWLDALTSHFEAISFNRPLWLFTAVVLGGLSFLNTWDVLIHLFVVVGAYFLGQWRQRLAGGWSRSILLAISLAISAVILYLPFYLGFRSQAGAPYLLPMLMQPTRLTHFLIIFGMPLFVVTLLLLSEAARRRFRNWQTGLISAVGLLVALFAVLTLFSWIVAASPEGASRTVNLANELGIALPARGSAGVDMGWGVQAVFALLPTVLGARLGSPWLVGLLAAFFGLAVMVWRTDFEPRDATPSAETPSNRTLPFVLLLIVTATLLTIGPEFVYLRDNFGMRLNTIFKFYYQAWAMFGVAALYGIGYLWLTATGVRRVVPAVATVGYGLALGLSLLFPYLAVNSRAQEFRGPVSAENRTPATLNGLAQVERFNPDEYAALMWLRDHADANDVLVEAVGGSYSGYARVAANTGVPSVLGWPGHEYQWRGTTSEPGEREPAVSDIYSHPRLSDIAFLLDLYDVDFIYVGNLERDTYGTEGLQKFADALEVAYQNNSVTIYRWHAQ